MAGQCTYVNVQNAGAGVASSDYTYQCKRGIVNDRETSDKVIVPEHIAYFFYLFDEALPRAYNQHQPNATGDRCYNCYQPWPCDIRQWSRTLLKKKQALPPQRGV